MVRSYHWQRIMNAWGRGKQAWSKSVARCLMKVAWLQPFLLTLIQGLREKNTAEIELKCGYEDK